MTWKEFFSRDYVAGTTPGVTRAFMRCKSCHAVYRHYWGCIPPGEKGQIGCKCGGTLAGFARLPEWQAAWWVISCYVWRKLILKKTFWDPRMPIRYEVPSE